MGVIYLKKSMRLKCLFNHSTNGFVYIEVF